MECIVNSYLSYNTRAPIILSYNTRAPIILSYNTRAPIILSYSTRAPIVLYRKYRFADLLVWNCHVTILNMGVQTLMELRANKKFVQKILQV